MPIDKKKQVTYSSQSRVAHYYRGKQASALRNRLIVFVPLAIFLALVFTDVFFFKLTVGDESMAPTLAKDRGYWFSSIRFGLVKPFSTNRPDNRFGSIEKRLARGQIVAVDNPLSPASTIPGNMMRFVFRLVTFGLYRSDQDLMTVRRILAFPGESVRIANKQIFINNQPFIPNWRISYQDNQLLSEKISSRDSIKEIYVPANEVFLINDNWIVQNDSRELGTLPYHKIRGLLMDKVE